MLGVVDRPLKVLLPRRILDFLCCVSISNTCFPSVIAKLQILHATSSHMCNSPPVTCKLNIGGRHMHAKPVKIVCYLLFYNQKELIVL